MKKSFILSIGIVFINLIANANALVTSEELHFSKQRVQELLEWHKNHPGEMPKFTEAETYELFSKDGLPVPNSGVTIQQFDPSMVNSGHALVIKSNIEEFKKNGYIRKYNQNAVALSTIKQSADEQFKSYASYKDIPYDTRMRHSWQELRIAYKYNPVNSDLVEETIGFAPESTYLKTGWTGVSQFFVPKDKPFVCALRTVSVPLTGTSAILNDDTTSYEINNKVTTVSVSGDEPSGYLYEIMWWDNDFRRLLECSANNYSDQIKTSVIELAKAIDKS